MSHLSTALRTTDQSYFDRTVTLTVQNNTTHTLTDGHTSVDHGKISVSPPSTILPGATMRFVCVSYGLYGPVGHLKYTVLSKDDIDIYWNHPMTSSPSKYTLTVPTPHLYGSIFPPNPVGQEQQIFLMINDSTLDPHHNWMSSMNSDIGNKHLYEIAIPGTHDSGTYSLYGAIAPDGSDVVKQLVALLSPQTVLPYILRWAVAQGMPILTQLLAGVRYLDIRLAYDDSIKDCRICHGLFGAKITDIMGEVAAFYEDKSHSNEIVMIDFNHFYEMDSTKHDALIAAITKIIPASLLIPDAIWQQNLTINQILSSTTGRIAIWYGDRGTVSRHNECLININYDDNWPNVENIDSLKSDLTNYINSRPSNQMFILQGIFTESTETIAKSVVNPYSGDQPHSLEEQACIVNPPLSSWLDNEWKTAPINIFINDWACCSGIIGQVIRRNGSTLLTIPITELTDGNEFLLKDGDEEWMMVATTDEVRAARRAQQVSSVASSPMRDMHHSNSNVSSVMTSNCTLVPSFTLKAFINMKEKGAEIHRFSLGCPKYDQLINELNRIYLTLSGSQYPTLSVEYTWIITYQRAMNQLEWITIENSHELQEAFRSCENQSGGDTLKIRAVVIEKPFNSTRLR